MTTRRRHQAMTSTIKQDQSVQCDFENCDREIAARAIPEVVILKRVPEKYTGGKLDTFIAKFNIFCEVNGWINDAEKVQHLALSLDETLFEAYTKLPGATKASYRSVVTALKKFKYPSEMKELNKLEFQQKSQGVDECIDSFVSELERIFDAAYADVPEHLRDEMLRDKFVAGLRNPKVRLLVRQSRPRSLGEAKS